MTRAKTLRNITKVLLRINKLLSARTSAFEILKGLLTFKGAIRGVVEMAEVIKLSNHMRSLLVEFEQDQKIFGGEFLYDEIDLFEAFQRI